MYKVGCKLRWYNFSHAVTWWLLLIAIWIFTKRSQTRTVNRDLFIAQSIIIAADPQCGYVFLYKIDLSSLSTLLLQNGRWKEKQKKKKKTFTEVEKKLQRNCFLSMQWQRLWIILQSVVNCLGALTHEPSHHFWRKIYFSSGQCMF